ncbi:hypothetical protein [Streptomyces barkulensis]|uniref:hypothetical protein n=1 Tax=Streptomyces barkulensis TaxID=1257026 RepID=UPI000C6E1E68|nr:hypothetical protein [Streptomyces barkulensis]
MLSLLAAGAAVTLTVWSVSMIRSVRWRALVYSLPIPITVVLLVNPVRVDGGQLLGVVALNVFFAVIALLHTRWGWHIALADLAGVLVYIALGRAIALFGPVPLAPVLVVVCAAWAVAVVLLPPAPGPAPEPPSRAGPLVKLGTAAGGSMVMVAAGQYLKGLVVTFPYSGVLTAIETRHDLVRFARHFTRNSISLVAFFTAYQMVQQQGRPAALAAGWLVHAVCVLGLHLRRPGARAPSAGEP